MPRITKRLPADRANYSFGDLVYWHLFKYGARPNGKPSDKAGRVWDLDNICSLLDITPRTLRNWIADKHLPDTITPLSQELFGNSPAWDEARLELQAKFEDGWAARRPGMRPAKTDQASGVDPEPAIDATSGHAGSSENDQATSSSDRTEGKDEGGSRASRVIQPRAPDRLRPIPVSSQEPRWPGRALIAGLTVVFGIAGWMQFSRRAEPPSREPQKIAEAQPPKIEPPKSIVEEVKPPAIGLPATLAVPAAPPSAAPAEDKRAFLESTPAPPPPSIEDKRAAEQKLLAEKLVAARQAAHELEMRRREDEARKLDGELKSATSRQRQLEDDARTLAGIGFRLRENTSVAGSSFRLLTGNIADCALACVQNSCDAFSWYRDQHPLSSPKRRYCYLFKRPFEIANYPGYALGEPAADPLVKSSLAPSAGIDRPVRLAQAGPPKAIPAQADDLTRCVGGPVKVTGFKLSCDRTLGGGTTLGSAQLSYTVANINECAAKCRPIARCVGFTFNSGDPPGRHGCIIFGPTPEGRVSKGWISGVR